MTNGEKDESDGITLQVIFKLMVFILTIVATVVGNTLICVSLIKFRHLRTNTNFILVSLALTDLSMVFIMVLNAATAVREEWIFGETCCRVVASLGLTLSFISIVHLCLLSVDRYIAIQKPFRYPLIITRRRVFAVLLAVWFTVSLALNVPLADYAFRADTYGCSATSYRSSQSTSPYIFFLVGIFVFLPFAVTCFCHAVVLKTAFTQARQLSKVAEHRLRLSSANMDGDPRQEPPVETCSLMREIKSAKTFGLVVGMFLLCYTPFYVAGTYRKIAGPDVVTRNVMQATMWIAFANSFCNPIVYGLRYLPFRKAFKTLCYCGRTGPRGAAYSSSRVNAAGAQVRRKGTLLSPSSVL